MKKLFIASVLLGLIINSYPQLKFFFPDFNAYFSVSYMKFWFNDDTIIEDLKYKKVYMQSHDTIADFNKTHYFAVIREDTMAEKIYCIYGKHEEFLLYDFSVNVGDNVKFYSLWCWWTPQLKELIVKSIDSVLIDNLYRKRINFGYNKHEESRIEGIGSTNGLFFCGMV
jgi:hypothetical protein